MIELSVAAQIVLFCSHNIYINETNDLKMISNGEHGVPNILHMQKNIIRAIEEMAPEKKISMKFLFFLKKKKGDK